METKCEVEQMSLNPNPTEQPEMISEADLNTKDAKHPLTAKCSVTCPEDSLLLLQYPWKCELKLKLDNIQPLEIDIWSNKVRDYHVFMKSNEVAPVIRKVKGYGLHARPIKTEPPMDEPREDKTNELINQAHALIDTAKNFVTKPVSHTHPRKRKAAKTEDDQKALDVLQDVTIAKLKPLHVKTNGTN